MWGRTFFQTGVIGQLQPFQVECSGGWLDGQRLTNDWQLRANTKPPCLFVPRRQWSVGIDLNMRDETAVSGEVVCRAES
jgi:hypothetical protein